MVLLCERKWDPERNLFARRRRGNKSESITDDRKKEFRCKEEGPSEVAWRKLNHFGWVLILSALRTMGLHISFSIIRTLLFSSLFFSHVSCLHDSLNFILPPLGRECFYEDIDVGLGARLIEIFVPTGSNLNLQLEVKQSLLVYLNPHSE
jgi:hypothetical protein